ncbi:MAG: GFA family protein [Porticoccaceae bacterium]|nr:GFA family protein [Porticoccaceae bacterium]
MCQKISGSAHVSNLFTKPENIEWLKGEHAISSYDIPDNQVRRVFCSTCGTGLPFVTQSGKFLIVPAGSLADQPSIKPEHAIFWADRMPWYDQVPELQHFSGYPK